MFPNLLFCDIVVIINRNKNENIQNSCQKYFEVLLEVCKFCSCKTYTCKVSAFATLFVKSQQFNLHIIKKITVESPFSFDKAHKH